MCQLFVDTHRSRHRDQWISTYPVSSGFYFNRHWLRPHCTRCLHDTGEPGKRQSSLSASLCQYKMVEPSTTRIYRRKEIDKLKIKKNTRQAKIVMDPENVLTMNITATFAKEKKGKKKHQHRTQRAHIQTNFPASLRFLLHLLNGDESHNYVQ